MRRARSVPSSAGLAAGMVLASVALAAPSHASTTCGALVDNLASPNYTLAVGDSVTMTVSCMTSGVNTSFVGSITATAPGGVTITSANPATAVSGVATFTILGSSVGLVMVNFNGGGASQIGQGFDVTGGSDSGGPSGTTSDAVASAPVEVSLSLDLAASGASCKEGSAATGLMGAWLYLPAAGDCSSTTKPNAKLLGWSTSANFPVQRAQSQVDNRWGAIDEVFDGVRMIFIPAGQATFVSGANSLHPIWAS